MERGPEPAERPLVLVVDDDGDVREAVAEVLRDQGYDVETAANGQVALKHLETGLAPDVLVLDLMMPIVDGWSVLAHLKDTPALAHIPVLVITAAGGSVVEPIASLTHGFLKKPLDLEHLLDALERCRSAAA